MKFHIPFTIQSFDKQRRGTDLIKKRIKYKKKSKLGDQLKMQELI